LCEDNDENGNCVTSSGNFTKDGGKGGSQKPPSKPEFENLPIDPAVTDGVQWFGGTSNAYQLKYLAGSNIYQYCHYFHCGLDILAPWGTPVTAGVYGQVIYAGCSSGIKEGPCKVQIKVGEYVITYGHLSGSPLVSNGYVYPNTVLGGAGTNSRSSGNPDLPDPNQNFTHIHLEIRGPGGWAGPSINPLLFMSNSSVAALLTIAANQTVDPQMAVFSDGTSIYPYPPPAALMPDKIWRTNLDNSYFP
jgi:murein DD-endopeptidase MepM/ murein hydrolase activator NlpD